MLPPVIDLAKFVLNLWCFTLMAGFSKSLAHLLKLDFVLLGYSNFFLIILDSKEQSKSQGTYSEYTLLYTTKWTIQKYKWILFFFGD